MSRAFKHLNRQILKIFNITFTHGTVNHTCLTETAASYATTLNLKHNSVLYSLNKRNKRFFRIICVA